MIEFLNTFATGELFNAVIVAVTGVIASVFFGGMGGMLAGMHIAHRKAAEVGECHLPPHEDVRRIFQ